MTPRRWMSLFALCAFAAGCNSDAPPAPHGAPVLLNVYWIAGASRFTVWSPPGAPDPMQVSPAPALASEVHFVFDRRLDGARIEDTVNVDGVDMPRSKAMPPIKASWPAQTEFMSDPPFRFDVLYNSAAIYGGTTSYVFARPNQAGFPSGKTVSFELDRASITNHYGETLEAPDSVPVVTTDFTVEVRAPAGPDGGAAAAVGTDFKLPLSFSNRLAAVAGLRPYIHARTGGVELPVDLLVDARTPTLLYLVPAACLGAWPAGATIDVTVDAGLPDAFRVPLAASATASFTTGAGPPQSADACPAPADGGA